MKSYKFMQTYTKLHIMLIIMCQNSHSEEKKHRMCSRTHAMEKNVEIVFDIFFRTIRSVQLVSLWANTEVISFEKRANSVTNDTHTTCCDDYVAWFRCQN